MNKNALEILSKYYGYSSFRNGQEDIINSIISNNDVLAIMPTGGGKSICYQIPALVLDGVTLVISPLISLMKDQVDTLTSMNIEAVYINSSLGTREFNEILEGIENDKYKIIYVAPERLESFEFINIIRNKNISQLAIDEAHCVSQWGHDFRLSYRKISLFIDSLYKRPIITAFTATASNEVRKDIIKLLELNNPDTYITGFDRENLSINIVKSSGKNRYLLDYIENHKNESGIIYAATRKEVENIYQGLIKRNISVSRYHAGLSQEERKINQEEFIKDNIDIMVATNAFGMGIDKPNIRWVIHYNMPQSIENYYQEIGRAGRDGEKSECILLFAPGDLHIQKYLIDIGVENPQRKLFQHKKLQQMVDLVYSNSCYRKSILTYFGEEGKDDCNNCSNCLNEGEVVDKTLDAQKVISCIARMKRSFGTTMIVDVLRGSKNKKVIGLRFNELTTYGIMKDYSSEGLKNFINTLVSHGYLELVENLGARGSFPTIKLNEQSTKVIKGESKVEFKEAIVSKAINISSELYESLKELRHTIAIENQIAPYMVFGDGTLRVMCSTYPTSREEMLSISGVGEVKYDRYGKVFEDVILKYVEEKNIDKNKTNSDGEGTNDGKDNEFFIVNTDYKLYELLKEYRQNEAKSQGIAPFMVLGNNTLKEISGRYPEDEEDLKDISGIGPAKINKYGENILKIVEDYVRSNDITVTWEDKKRLKLVLDGESRKNNEIALDLLNQGETLKNISYELEISLSTLMGYVCDYVKENKDIKFKINFKDYYTEEEKEMIEAAINNFGEEKIGEIKKALPEYIRYESIRAVILEKYIK
ncbi:DNA helicase RecQ [Romboutsia weinsteinii]|uniref:DNA helicase RecQ n=1 Tax=Romboutsia weinsteinii TaxID=2020949 RepID=A0A371J8E1_9FIRM|nr:DNA helicase RecQ [Romboutsia weinsteinii]RDY29032.1 DNA helicase RecQ [Romboutsia weinsteinii]